MAQAQAEGQAEQLSKSRSAGQNFSQPRTNLVVSLCAESLLSHLPVDLGWVDWNFGCTMFHTADRTHLTDRKTLTEIACKTVVYIIGLLDIVDICLG